MGVGMIEGAYGGAPLFFVFFPLPLSVSQLYSTPCTENIDIVNRRRI